MARNIMQDVMVGKRKKSISFVLPPDPALRERVEPAKRERKFPPITPRPGKESGRPSFHPPKKRKANWFKKPVFWGWGTGVILAAGIIFVLGAFFSKAVIEVSPRTASMPIALQLSAKKGGDGSVPFEIVMVKGSQTKEIAATGTEQVERKASGVIVVYNNYSSIPQKLVKNTRFESSAGKIYRVQNNITVPGIYQKNGESIPGSLEITVYADKAGTSYNSGLTDFTIPGFKGDPKYSKFYARSKTEITGGFSGSAPVASEKDISAAKMAIERSLKEDLLREAGSQIPPGYILYKDAVQVNFENIKDISSDTKAVLLREEATLVGILLKEDSLSAEITKSLVAKAKDDKPFSLDSPEPAKFSFASGTPKIDDKTEEISFALGGSVNTTYLIDKDSLAKELASKPKKEFQAILMNYPSVYKARIANWQPFWARYFPSKPERIGINIAPEQ